MMTEEKDFGFKDVTSSFISQVGYNEEMRELRVNFSNGTKWRYFDIAPEKYISFLLAESQGKFFIHRIKPNYTGRKIKEEKTDEVA
ncbi:MAG TPA: KTSC domain-containing protein [Desulfobacteraceae bacterium]|nr:KTSC domain-containing protein [Desulfobacteraceae bacterium]